jgi:putative membrane protein
MLEKETPYQSVKGQLILRDHLAADRTILANERTFLAYIRTALTLFVAGLSFVHFEIVSKMVSSLLADRAIGVVLMVLGTITFFLGLFRYNKMKALIREIKQKESAEGTDDGN